MEHWIAASSDLYKGVFSHWSKWRLMKGNYV